MPTPFEPSEEPAEWWARLTSEQQASVRRVLGKDWHPSLSSDEVAQMFDETRRRIREIEKRALGKLGDGGDNEPSNT